MTAGHHRETAHPSDCSLCNLRRCRTQQQISSNRRITPAAIEPAMMAILCQPENQSAAADSPGTGNVSSTANAYGREAAPTLPAVSTDLTLNV